jgi:hypothetical protein
VSGGSRFIIRGLTVQNTAKGDLISLSASASNLIFDGNRLMAQADVSAWSQADWRNKAPNGVISQANCVTIVNNRIENVAFGMQIMGDKTLVQGNTLNNLGADGIDINASEVTVRRNRITNMLDIGDGNHSDMIQAWNLTNTIFHDIVIDGNTCINQTVANLRFANVDAQGITEFDGAWSNYAVINNIVVTNHWHAISIYGADNAQIMNNTVLGSNSSRTVWLGVFNSKSGAAPKNNVVRNNLASSFDLAKGVVGDHNLSVSKPSALFVKFDPSQFAYDLHLLSGSAAIGAGTALGAPATDITGFVRTSPIDAGAYEYEDRN